MFYIIVTGLDARRLIFLNKILSVGLKARFNLFRKIDVQFLCSTFRYMVPKLEPYLNLTHLTYFANNLGAFLKIQ